MPSPDNNLPLPVTSHEIIKTGDAIEPINGTLFEIPNNENAKYYRAILTAALGSIPWVGGVFSTLITLQAESEQEQVNELQQMWLEEHREKIFALSGTFNEITRRLDEFCTNEQVKVIVLERIQSPEYINLVRETFKAWDEASTVDKRNYFKRLIINAAASNLCTDDMIRIFIKWIGQYHEYHIQIISAVYNNHGITLGGIWEKIFANGNERPRENSASADLYRTLIRDLQMGGVIRGRREVNYEGEFIKKSTRGSGRNQSSNVMKSSFDDEDDQELSELGAQFVSYVLQDLVLRLEK